MEVCKKKLKLKNGVQVEVTDWTKKQICCYCGKTFATKLGRHLETAHSDKSEVKKLMELEVKKVATKERRAALRKLANLGAFKNNISVLKSGTGSLLVVKRPTEPRKSSDYYPCIYCLGFYAKGSIFQTQFYKFLDCSLDTLHQYFDINQVGKVCNFAGLLS